MKKDTIYIDNDDEITSITDKVQSSSSDIIALVLPKRCTVLQSSVNMKILNRAAQNANKNVVLITSEAALLPVAGAVGLYVAKTLQSKPVVPPAPTYDEEAVTSVDESEEEPAIDANKSIGELAGATALAAVAVSSQKEDEPIELGDDTDTNDGGKKDTKAKSEKKNRKLKVPNFDSFRVKLFALIGGIILFGVLWYVANNVLPRATITVTTENKTVPVAITVTASPSAQSINVDGSVVPAQTKSIDKTESKKFSATGQKNNGNKASGKVKFSVPCSAVSGSPITVPAGTGISTGGLTFITQADAALTTSNFSGGCKFVSDDTAVMAQNAGDQYNISSGRTFTVAGFSSVTATNSSGMSGGTNNIVKVVSQSDCDTAKNELLNTKTDAYKAELSSQLTVAGFTPINDSFTVTPTKTTCSPDVGAEATEATATVTFKASMTGINTAGLDQLIQNSASKDIKESQSIIDSGSKTAVISIKETKSNGDIVISVQATAQAGVKQDATAIASSVTGKKRGDTMTAIEAMPGVTSVKVDYKPFWVSKTPKNVKHITIVFVNNGN